MQNYKQFFKGKKITVMGLGLLGRGVGYTKFLAECLFESQSEADGADLIVTDLKTKEQLKTSVEEIKNYELARRQGGLKIKNKDKIKFVLGEHRLEDFRNRDMIIKAAGVPLDSPYIAEARRHGIPIEMDVSLFAKLAPEVVIVGVTGTRGKSMTTQLIYEILKQNIKDRKIYLGGNVRGVATLPLLKKVKSRASMDTARHDSAESDILVCELDSWQLQGFGEAKISPHISVFTSFMPDHMNYYGSTPSSSSGQVSSPQVKAMKKYFDDKANIFKYQEKGDILIIRPGMKEFIKKWKAKSSKAGSPDAFEEAFRGKLIVVNPKDVENWKFNVLGSHQRENLSCAVEVAKQLGIPLSKIKKSVAQFKGLEGRMQLLRIYKGIKIYNDNNATTPEATIAGLKALSPHRQGLWGRKIILICGGADKNLPLDNLVKDINKYCKMVVMIPGTGTEKLVASDKLLVSSKQTKNLKAKSTKGGSLGTSREVLREAVKIALGKASRGDIILFSPAFASFGMFNNEYERNDEFIKIIKKLG